MSQQISSLDLAAIHNSYCLLVKAYGQMLAEQERRMEMLAAQLKASQEEGVKLRKALADALGQALGSER